MAIKLNIRPEIEFEMNTVLNQMTFKSKTEYINKAIQMYNQKLKRTLEISRLESYFKNYQKEGGDIANEFAQLRKS